VSEEHVIPYTITSQESDDLRQTLRKKGIWFWRRIRDCASTASLLLSMSNQHSYLTSQQSVPRGESNKRTPCYWCIIVQVTSTHKWCDGYS
jgi:hypothetical protein